MPEPRTYTVVAYAMPRKHKPKKLAKGNKYRRKSYDLPRLALRKQGNEQVNYLLSGAWRLYDDEDDPFMARTLERQRIRAQCPHWTPQQVERHFRQLLEWRAEPEQPDPDW